MWPFGTKPKTLSQILRGLGTRDTPAAPSAPEPVRGGALRELLDSLEKPANLIPAAFNRDLLSDDFSVRASVHVPPTYFPSSRGTHLIVDMRVREWETRRLAQDKKP